MPHERTGSPAPRPRRLTKAVTPHDSPMRQGPLTRATRKDTESTCCSESDSNSPTSKWLVIWWHLQKPYAGEFADEVEASLHAAARNGIMIEIVSKKVSFGSIVDYWRRDDEGNPIPVEWRTARESQ